MPTTRPNTDLRALCRVVEDLHAPAQALRAAAAGLAAGVHNSTITPDDIYFLLDAVASQLDAAIQRVDTTLQHS